MNAPLKTSAAALLLAVFLAGCDESNPAALPTVPIKIGSQTYTIEIAATHQSRARGLMRRDAMAKDHGMIFVFPKVELQSFWMKNTRIPLDLIYLDASGRVVSIHRLEPYNLKGVTSPEPIKYAIELNRGQVSVAGVKPGDLIQIPLPARDVTTSD
jgi:uncharacterized membrane protein (UPF0127 family)